MWAPLVACTLASILAAGYARQCQTCSGINTNMCGGIVRTCAAAEDVCLSMYTKRLFKNAPETLEFVRMCGKSSLCKQGQTLTAPSFTLRQSITCCTADNCIPPIPQLPDKPDKVENGVNCTACYRDGSYCDTKEIMKCTGTEIKCARYSSRTDKDSKTTEFAVRGCASENVCAVGSSTLTYEGSTMKIDMACTDAGIRPEHGFLLPLVAGLVLMNLVS